MPTLERVKELHKQLTSEGFALIEKKGHDYNRAQQNNGDTLYNLRVAHLLGLVDSPQASVAVRMCDKIMRLSSLRNPNTQAKVKDENIKDTIRDLINYAVYFYAFYEEETKRKQIAEISDTQHMKRTYSDPFVDSFLQEMCVLGIDKKVECGRIVKAFAKYCNDNGIGHVPLNDLLESITYINTVEKKLMRKIDDKRHTWYYFGMALKEDLEKQQEDKTTQCQFSGCSETKDVERFWSHEEGYVSLCKEHTELNVKDNTGYPDPERKAEKNETRKTKI